MATSPTADDGPRRFVVLHHTGGESPHYDLLFETTGKADLVTFRLDEWPACKPQLATRLRDHRRFYLTYEGPISGDRGRVDRVAEGMLHVIGTASGWLLKQTDGTPFLLLEPPEPGSEHWTVTPAPADG